MSRFIPVGDMVSFHEASAVYHKAVYEHMVLEHIELHAFDIKAKLESHVADLNSALDWDGMPYKFKMCLWLLVDGVRGRRSISWRTYYAGLLNVDNLFVYLLDRGGITFHRFRDRIPNHYTHCSECSDIHLENDYAYDSDPICHSCRDTHYTFNDHEGTYVSIGDVDDYDSDDYAGVYNYDADPLDFLPHVLMSDREKARKLKKNFNPLLLGVELEVERKSGIGRNSSRETAEEIEGFGILKSDGSLDNGFELVSAPATFEYHVSGKDGTESPWDKFFNGSRKNYNSFKTDTCGVHVHISRAALTPLQIGKIVIMVNSVDNRPYIDRIVGRGYVHYCKHMEGATIKEHLKVDLQYDKYHQINLGKSKTIELRMFKGNLSRKGFFRYIEFTQALVEYCGEASYRHLTVPNFASWLNAPENHSRFTNLHDFMFERWAEEFGSNYRKKLPKKLPASRLDTNKEIKALSKSRPDRYSSADAKWHQAERNDFWERQVVRKTNIDTVIDVDARVDDFAREYFTPRTSVRIGR